ncbi:hypothetical protein Trydic_g1546 [Trypoxylus dichotomus]
MNAVGIMQRIRRTPRQGRTPYTYLHSKSPVNLHETESDVKKGESGSAICLTNRRTNVSTTERSKANTFCLGSRRSTTSRRGAIV